MNDYLNGLLSYSIECGASDVHITNGLVPSFRINGELVQVNNFATVGTETFNSFLKCTLDQTQIKAFMTNHELDYAFSEKFKDGKTQRFRANVSMSLGQPFLTLRLIPTVVKSLGELGIPVQILNICERLNGLFLVTGPTGSGKSTTLAAIIKEINHNKKAHIITIEDPVECIHSNEKGLIHQREVGSDTACFADAVKHALRQDPDVLMVGEMRDYETIYAAITAAETGCLVMSTLHTPNATQSIDRILDVFPASQQKQMTKHLASLLIGILSQQLIPRSDGSGRIVATEYLYMNHAVRNCMREGKLEQVKNIIQMGAQEGMHTMDQCIASLVSTGYINRDSAFKYCHSLKDLRRYLR